MQKLQKNTQIIKENDTFEEKDIQIESEMFVEKDNEIVVIKKLSEYMSYVEKLSENFNLSRGQSRDYPLVPGAFRKDERGKRKYSKQVTAHFLKEFRINSHLYMDKPWDVKNDYEWMIHAQHYGIPTKLLDFSRSHIISLMFAVEKAFDESLEDPRNGVVWFLNSKTLNSLHSSRSDLFMLSDNELKLNDCDGPVVVQSRKANVRVNAQNGVFLYFQDSDEDLMTAIENNIKSNTNNSEDIIKKVIIDGDSKKDILVALFSMGFGYTQIYPELTSVSKDILLLDKIKQHKQSQGEMEDE